MPVRAATYALARPVPYFLERGVSQTIQAPIRHGVDGALISPASGKLTIIRPDSTNLLSAVTVTVSGSIAGYEFTPAATEPVGEGYTVRWTLVFGSATYPIFQTSAYMCEYLPPNVISAADLYDELPELKHRVPQSQGERGDDVGWQPQIDGAYYDFLRVLLADGRKPWLLREASGYRDFILAKAMRRAIATVAAGPDSSWAQHAKTWWHQENSAKAAMRLQYSSDDPSLRRGGSPAIRLCPVGRPQW